MITPIYSPAPGRYENGMKYRRCGKGGILLPEISLGLWHNFGDVNTFANSLSMAHYAFDKGITHFDLANNYGPSCGSAEETFGTIMKKSFMPYRDELFISTKAGHEMWPGPYGDWGSRKSLMSNLNQSLKRMNLEYVDIFYTHRYDPNTPLEETLQTLVDIVRQGKALYIGISKYPKDKAELAYKYLEERDVHCLLYQGKYNLFNREPEEEGILRQAKENGTGFIAFSPLAQGLLTRQLTACEPNVLVNGKCTGQPQCIVTDKAIGTVRVLIGAVRLIIIGQCSRKIYFGQQVCTESTVFPIGCLQFVERHGSIYRLGTRQCNGFR